MTKGWYQESAKHAMARKGMKTKNKHYAEGRVLFTKNASAEPYFVREGAGIFGDGGRIVGRTMTLEEAKDIASRRKDIVGKKEAVTIEKFILGTTKIER